MLARNLMIVFVAAIACMAQGHTTQGRTYACVRSLGLIAYPPIARQARIQGTVEAEVTLQAKGLPGKIKVGDGHPLLKKQTEEAVRGWRYTCGHDHCIGGEKIALVVEFRLEGEPLYLDCPQVSVTQADHSIRVLLLSHPPQWMP